jgi:hypothetical protein
VNLVIELLEKELERQNLLIASNEHIKQKRKEFPNMKDDGPLIEFVYPNMVKLKSQLEDAIALLKTQNNGN